MFQLELSAAQWIVFLLCGLLLGMSKTGIAGAGLMVVPLMAGIFGGKESVAIVLPMLITADIFAVKYYNRHANWKYIIKLLPWTLLGVIMGLFFGNSINDEQFRTSIAILVILGIILMIWLDLAKSRIKIPDHWTVAMLLGAAGGFSSMVGNAAGPIITLYFLAMHLPKNKFIGTGAWFYFIMNLSKMPVHIFSWETINLHTLSFNLLAIPPIIAGAYLGIYLVRLIPEKAYRIFIIISTLLAALFLF